jgi:hypothetical protein
MSSLDDIKVKSSLVKILNVLGFKSIRDRETIVPTDIFCKLNSQLVFWLVREYKIKTNLDILSSDLKLEIINLVLELHHNVTIDYVKKGEDSLTSGYKLVQIIPGF